MQNEMIRIDSNPKMAAAIQRAKTQLEKMHVRQVEGGIYSVRNGGGKTYVVEIVEVKGMLLATCDCVNQNRSACKHMAVAAGLDSAIKAGYAKEATPEVASCERFAHFEDIDPDWTDPAVQQRWNAMVEPAHAAAAASLTHTTNRGELLAEVEQRWQARWPNHKIAEATMKDFGKSRLDMLTSAQLEDALRFWFVPAA